MKTTQSKCFFSVAIIISLLLLSCIGFFGCDGTPERTPVDFSFEIHEPSDEMGFADGYGYVLCRDDCVMITDGSAAKGDVEIPATIAGKTVVGITDSAFRNNSSITSLSLPSTLEYIACYAFANCSSLTSVTATDTLWQVGGGAFSDTPFLKSQSDEFVTIGDSVLIAYNGSSREVIIPEDIKHIGGAFLGNGELLGVVLGDNVRSISEYSFAGCISLSSFDFGISLAYIGDGTFASAEMLQGVILPDTVKYIGTEAFLNCYQIKYAYLGNSLTSVGDEPFSYCQGLRLIYLPSTLTSIQSAYFSDCVSLTLILYGGSAEEFDAIALNNGDGSFKKINIVYNYTGGINE